LFIYFAVFEAQTESFCKRLCQASTLIFYDRDVTQTSYFSLIGGGIKSITQQVYLMMFIRG